MQTTVYVQRYAARIVRSATPNNKPHGRDEVVSALVVAATKLFAERGITAVSLRDVASEAGVNLGLIHRHIGGKHDLLAMVLAARPGMPPHDGKPLKTPEQLVDYVLEFMTSDAPYPRIVLRAALDGLDVESLQDSFPILERGAKALRAEVPRRDADLRVALVTAAVLGWQVASPLALGILKQHEVKRDQLVQVLRPALLALLRADVDRS